MSNEHRKELIEHLNYAGRVLSTAAVMFHTALAARVGMTATEEKALDLLERFGPLTAGELGTRSGLAPASVTGLVDRLEAKGFARRMPHPQDGRRVLIEVRPDRLAPMAPLFDDFVGSLGELYKEFSDDQLETILHFLTEAARRQEEATAKLTR